MTATATDGEIEVIRFDLELKSSNSVLLRASPIQNQFIYVTEERLPNIHGSFGEEKLNGE